MVTVEPQLKGKYKNAHHRHKNLHKTYGDRNVIGGNDIAPLPECKNIERRESTRRSFKLFCETYHAKKFRLRWSNTHLDLINTIEKSILSNTGQFAYACPRGFGKTSLAEVAAQWALFHAHRRYVMLVGATNTHALELASSILTDIETNELYMEDFPEICYPVVQLEGLYVKAKTQHIDGNLTKIVYSKNKFVLPTVKDSPASGSVFQCVSITGRVRGAKFLTADGVSLRPDLVLIDDPQTDKTAKSNKMVEQRERVITGAIAGLCGPDEEITILMPCTVIRKDDLAERFLDQTTKPEWQGKRTKLLERFPSRMDLWHKYKEIRDESYRCGNFGLDATEFYRSNRREMDEGAVVSWNERYNPKRQLSAIQAAMDLYFTNPHGFASEYQNEPLIESNDGIVHDLALTVDKLQDRTSGLPYRKVPRSTLHLTTGLDIQGKILYYVTTAWTEDFGGVIVDYGTWPKQPMLTGWSTQDPPIHLGSDNPKLLSTETRVYDGLSKLKDQIFSRGFIRDESTDVMHIGRIGIDANWALSSSAVYSFVREFGSVNDRFIACHGRGISSRMLPMVDWAKKVGEIKGDDWRILPSTVAVNRGRHLSFDTNSWKSTIAERLLLPKGSDNCLLFYGDNITIHEPLINSLTEEYPVSREGRFRRINEWVTDKGSASENHYWDCYDKETEVLTYDGWKLFDDVTFDDKIATVNMETDLLEYQTPECIIKKPYSGNMVQIGGESNSRLNLCVTPTHRMVVFEGQKSIGPKFKLAKDLTVWDKIKTKCSWEGKKFDSIKLSAVSNQPERSLDIKLIAEFMGWFVSEGSTHVAFQQSGNSYSYRTVISQSRSSNPQKYQQIKDLLNKLPWTFTEHDNGFTFTNKQVYELVSECGSNCYTRKVPQWIKNSSKDIIECFIKSAVAGDGWIHENHEVYATTSKQLSDDMQELYLKCGYNVSENIRKAKVYSIRGRAGSNTVNQYHVHRKVSKYGNLRDYRNKPNFKQVYYNDNVYCVSVPNQTLIVRRKGKVAVCGNCLILAAVSAASLGLKRHVKIVSVSTDGNMVTAPLPSKVRPVVHMTPTPSQGRKR